MTTVAVGAAFYITISQLFRVSCCNSLNYVPTQMSELNTLAFRDTICVTLNQLSELIIRAVRAKLQFLHPVNCHMSYAITSQLSEFTIVAISASFVCLTDIALKFSTCGHTAY